MTHNDRRVCGVGVLIKAKIKKMEKVLQLIRDKKAKLENIIYKAELIPNPTRNILRLINEYKDECSQLTEAELLLLNKPTEAITEAAHSAKLLL